MSAIEDTLAFQLASYGIKAEREKTFAPGRKYRADFYIAPRLLVEVQGSTWVSNTGHTSGRGVQRDYNKSNLAQLLGYTYLQFTTQEVKSGDAINDIIRFLEQREK